MGGCLSYKLIIVRDQNPNELTNFPKNVTPFSFKSLKKATNNFTTKVRMDGFSSSYKGTLQNGCRVTVMVLNTEDRNIDFNLLVEVMVCVKHKNVVELIGYCFEDDHRMVVHEFVGDYSLDQLLFRDSEARDFELDWGKRVSICHGIARALEYLHNGISPRVIFRDVKPSNVLMDSSFNPKFIGFDIARFLEDYESHGSSRVLGTFGYLDPEFAMTGRYSEKVDVYAFGITLLEIINGRRSYLFEQDGERIGLVEWAWELRESDRIPEIVDTAIFDFPEAEVIHFVNTALFCVQVPSEHRPSMSEVRLMLSGSYDVSNRVLIRPPRQSRQWSSHDELSGNSSNYEE